MVFSTYGIFHYRSVIIFYVNFLLFLCFYKYCIIKTLSCMPFAHNMPSGQFLELLKIVTRGVHINTVKIDFARVLQKVCANLYLRVRVPVFHAQPILYFIFLHII